MSIRDGRESEKAEKNSVEEEDLTKKIFKSMMLVLSITLVVGLAFILGILYRYFGRQIQVELDKEAVYLSYGVEEKGVSYLNNLKEKDSRITYVAADGTVLFDNETDAQSMENHGERDEIQKALKYGEGNSVRMSDTLGEKTIYHALRLKDGSVLRVSSTQYSALALVGELVLPMCWILALMLILSGIFASRLSRKIVEPVNTLNLDDPESNQIYEEVEPLLSRIYRQNRQIQNQLEAAKQQQEEFALITENMQEGLIVIDKYTMILSANTSAWRLFQVTKEEFGQSVYNLNRSEEFRKVIEDVLEGGHKETMLKMDSRDIQVIANPVVRERQVEGAVILLMNVTEKVERENLRREFSANVSHELKTPLTSISGIAEIIQDGYVQPDDVKHFAGRIYKESQHLIQLVEDVIRISQLDEAQVPYEWENVDLYQMAKDIFASLGERAKEQNVHLYIGGERTICRTVRPILEEAVYNLCENAVKYNRNDGSVSLLIREDEDKILLTVKDTGVGIPAEDQSRVFERFYRVDKSHSKEVSGTGLGLSIVKHAVTFLKGSITLKSREEMGTEITIGLPKERKE